MSTRTKLFAAAGAAAAAIIMSASGCSVQTSDSVVTPPSPSVSQAGPVGSVLQGQGVDNRPEVRRVKKEELPANIPIAFRLDDVQSYWCAACLVPIYDFFADHNTPLTAGVIAAGFADGAGESWAPPGAKNTKAAMKQFADAGVPFEVASHSYSHPEKGLPSLGGVKEQEEDLYKAQVDINEALGVFPSSLIPPTNRANADTFEAMKMTNHPGTPGMNVVSGQCSWPHNDEVVDPPATGTENYCSGNEGPGVPSPVHENGKAPDIVRNGITTVPAGAVIDSWSDYKLPADPELAYGEILTQYENQGFAVVMMHPQELSQDYCGSGGGSLTQGKMDLIADIISTGEKKGWQFQTFSSLAPSLTSK